MLYINYYSIECFFLIMYEILVSDAPTATVNYNEMQTLNRSLSLVLHDGDHGPTVVCESDGNPPARIEWSRENGTVLPSGLSQISSHNHRLSLVQLHWQRAVVFSDSGWYVCRATNNIGTSDATLQLLVLREFNKPL